jgi:pantothenate kinase
LKTYSGKLENLDKMGKFLDAYSQTKLNQDDINHLNNPITCNEIEEVIVSLQRRVQDLMDSQPNFTKLLKKN